MTQRILDSDPQRQWVLECGDRYWAAQSHRIAALPIVRQAHDPGPDPALRSVALPDWAADVGVDGCLLVFATNIVPGEGPEWKRCDWLATAFHMMAGSSEHALEQSGRNILSYAFRLPSSLTRLFDRAWVNRVFLFLRRWAEHAEQMPAGALFGPLPRARIVLTHDVDAVELTSEIRLKQSVFQISNAAKAIRRGRHGVARDRFGDAWRYGTARSDLHTLAMVQALEKAAGLTSLLHFYAGPPGLRRLNLRRILIDPAYDIASAQMRSSLRSLAEGGWAIGLHQSFDAWSDAEPMARELHRLETALGASVIACRQHWLHFSWQKTWKAQANAGLTADSTLGFNDRPAFRTGHALSIRPWSIADRAPLPIQILPMLFMDSHFYDYSDAGGPLPGAAMKPWLDEVQAVGGEVTVNWHTHTITEVYGWRAGFEALLELLA